MMITHYDFLAMSETEQYEAVWKGTFLGDRKDGNLWVQCYSLESFYIEVYYDAVNNKLLRIESFTSIHQLGPYIAQNNMGGHNFN